MVYFLKKKYIYNHDIENKIKYFWYIKNSKPNQRDKVLDFLLWEIFEHVWSSGLKNGSQEWIFPTNNNIFFVKKKYIYNHDIENKIKYFCYLRWNLIQNRIKETKSWIFFHEPKMRVLCEDHLYDDKKNII